MRVKEIRAKELNTDKFIKEQIRKISKTIGSGYAINALSGGVDSSVVTLLGHKALGKRLITLFIDNGLMRQGEPRAVVSMFKKLGVPVKLIHARDEFFKALKGVVDPEKKREAITRTFYKKVFGRLVKASGSNFLLQGTILTDIDETVAGIKRQHNVFEQLGIDPKKAFGYKIIEPLIQLRKDGVRKVAKAFGLPKSVYERIPFPGPALATRVIGEVTPKRIKVVRNATAITEAELAKIKAFQYLAILHHDKVTGMRDGKRAYGMQIEIRCWDSTDARIATPTKLNCYSNKIIS
jgi:GMP synthase (glutamine-hydrolysing)